MKRNIVRMIAAFSSVMATTTPTNGAAHTLTLLPAAKAGASCKGSSTDLGTGNVPVSDPDLKGSTVINIWFFAKSENDEPILWAYKTFNSKVWIQANRTAEAEGALRTYLGPVGARLFQDWPGLVNALLLEPPQPSFDQIQSEFHAGGIERQDCFSGTYRDGEFLQTKPRRSVTPI